MLDKELEEEECCQDVHSDAQLLVVAACDINKYVAQVSEYDTIRDAICQRHKQQA